MFVGMRVYMCVRLSCCCSIQSPLLLSALLSLFLQPLYYSRDQTTGQYKARALKGEEVAYVDQVGDTPGSFVCC